MNRSFAERFQLLAAEEESGEFPATHALTLRVNAPGPFREENDVPVTQKFAQIAKKAVSLCESLS
jgi:hypothetical protein